MKFGKQLSSGYDVVEGLIMEQVQRFGLTTRIVWERDEGLRPHGVRGIGAAVRRLTSKSILEAHALHHGRFYFTFTREFGQSQDPAICYGPLSETAKVRSFARLLLASQHLRGFGPLPREKLQSLLGNQAKGLPRAFMVSRETKKLVFLRIDTSPAAPPTRLAQKLRHDIYRIAGVPRLKTLVQKQVLGVAFATCTAPRCTAIKREFERYPQVGSVPVAAYPLPELLPLFTPVEIAGHH